MSLYGVYAEIKNNPQYAHFFRDNKYNPYTFYKYLNDVQFQKIKVIKLSASEGVIQNEFQVIDRFSETYRKSIIAKFYQLENWYDEFQPAVTFVTLTGRNIPDREQFFENLFYMRHLFFKKFTQFKKNYVWIIEPHMAQKNPNLENKNKGYPHVHGIIFEEVTEKEQAVLKRWWQKKGMGSYEHGIKFEKAERIKNIKNYIIKDMAKSWIRTEGKFSNEFKWDPELFIFNMIMWKNSYRFWGASKEISNIMKRPEQTEVFLPVLNVSFCPDENDIEIYKCNEEHAYTVCLEKNKRLKELI